MPKMPHHSEYTVAAAQLPVTLVTSTTDPDVWAYVVDLGDRTHVQLQLREADGSVRGCGSVTSDPNAVTLGTDYYVREAAKLVAERVSLRELRTRGIPQRRYCPACGAAYLALDGTPTGPPSAYDLTPVGETVLTAPETPALAVGTVLQFGVAGLRAPEPPDGTPLLGPDGTVERYRSKDVGGRWSQYLREMGPFVVAPDFEALTGIPSRRD